jgi:hypothetical protein
MLSAAGLAVLLATLTGCMAPMALKKNSTETLALKKPIALFALRTKNVLKPGYQAELKSVEAVSVSGKSNKFGPDKAYKEQEKEYNEYLISIELEPGDYTLRDVGGVASSFLITGGFVFPVNGKFTLAPGTVTYIGHVTMVNRQKKDGEPRSGSLFPLIDQSMTGYSDGTTDVIIEDQSESDLAAFVKEYPSLRGVTIAKKVMTK